VHHEAAAGKNGALSIKTGLPALPSSAIPSTHSPTFYRKQASGKLSPVQLFPEGALPEDLIEDMERAKEKTAREAEKSAAHFANRGGGVGADDVDIERNDNDHANDHGDADDDDSDRKSSHSFAEDDGKTSGVTDGGLGLKIDMSNVGGEFLAFGSTMGSSFMDLGAAVASNVGPPPSMNNTRLPSIEDIGIGTFTSLDTALEQTESKEPGTPI
jgi:hypothetical protein